MHFFLFIWLHQAFVAARGIFSCGMWDLVPDQGSHLGPLPWSLQSQPLNTSEVPVSQFFLVLGAFLWPGFSEQDLSSSSFFFFYNSLILSLAL